MWRRTVPRTVGTQVPNPTRKCSVQTYVILPRRGWATVADLPADENIAVADTVIVRPDPVPVAQTAAP
jgi:hypothetical protein